ncbi:hypothetical protein CLAFUW4_14345 [Fulvia fulva]|uniref:Uncharacterized protein n=1 Tax=Passalora fulva TaxID=5499 RepID=A0A9Q8PLN8_PASFU|nr:uncharacterized protein CLAFUR5_14175 [Fulvia fulva]KAK4609208.1 hypothetical protein CLAFUR4_14343 [Fulvia fulva]KAK4609638.1 hypothetical protein CLAFUR0_14347 [Fulvia fulva]UJO24899.1 hypothetical protein CLAFUR5_14175 [Fulvia fulva]WPV22841.1 hypothetical protein CLAFUW4_14345 [Fulvia fulva]WPV37484.1 hypothetical protein CLAFUW7_14351 [Fulvia fulva]
MATRTPPSALEPYLQLPPETSLILLTGTLGCNANWLTSRMISSTLSPPNNDESTEKPISVLLISWLRDLPFWKNELRRTTGLDISKLPKGHFTFLDLFTTPPPEPHLTNLILSTITTLKTTFPASKILLVLDGPDILLATGTLTSQNLNTLLLQLRSQVHATILSCSADLPLLAAATGSTESRPTPIEVESAAVLTTQAHNARTVMSVRELETGAAKDVSGVLRVTKGGDAEGYDGESEGGDGVKEAELLYLVQRDGNVKVFSRGSDQ